jgi:hypothetical protein
MGVALMDYDPGAVTSRHLAFVFMGLVLTLPSTGLASGVLWFRALNAPSV